MDQHQPLIAKLMTDIGELGFNARDRTDWCVGVTASEVDHIIHRTALLAYQEAIIDVMALLKKELKLNGTTEPTNRQPADKIYSIENQQG